VSSAILEIARQEFVLHRRNRWVISFAILFAALSLAVAYFGMITSGYSGFQDFVRTSASLVNLGGFLLPLFALLLGVFSFLTHREYLEVLATQPVSRSTLLLGKYFGLLISVLTAAALGDQAAVERIVIDKQEELHAMDPWRMQPIHWAAHCGHREVVGWLLDQGADVNAAADSWTPLHLAVEIGHEDVATLLLEHGADPEARLDDEHDSMTPMEMAKAWKLHKMVEFLGPYYG